VGVTQLLVEFVCASVACDGFEGICAEVLVDVQQGDCLHQRAEDDLLVIREVELKEGKGWKSASKLSFVKVT
jgi:hypothetical protein